MIPHQRSQGAQRIFEMKCSGCAMNRSRDAAQNLTPHPTNSLVKTDLSCGCILNQEKVTKASGHKKMPATPHPTHDFRMNPMLSSPAIRTPKQNVSNIEG